MFMMSVKNCDILGTYTCRIRCKSMELKRVRCCGNASAAFADERVTQREYKFGKSKIQQITTSHNFNLFSSA